jgi:uncharacterized protein YbjQ (UPF0145 family)
MAEEPPKKDLTSLLELSALEMANSPASHDGDPSMTLEPSPNLTEADFESLDDMGKHSDEATPEVTPEAIPEVSMDFSSSSQIGVGSDQAFDAPIMGIDSPPGESPVGSTMAPGLSTPPDPVFTTEPEFVAEPVAEPIFDQATDSNPIDQNRAVVNAPPAGMSQSKQSATPSPTAEKHDFSDVKEFGEKISIGHPSIEGAPAFSLLVKSATGKFSDKTVKAIEAALGSEDFGIRLSDVSIQLSAGKLLVPQISEFAAITLAQKLRDVVDNIEVDLASSIYKSSAADLSHGDDLFLMDAEKYDQRREEIHDMGAEPTNENELFSSNLSELSDFQITRILSAVTASEIVNAEIAESPTTSDFEMITERLSRALVARAFKLGAHGVLGISFTLKSIEGYKDTTGKVRRAYRLLGTGTAVRARKRHP